MLIRAEKVSGTVGKTKLKLIYLATTSQTTSQNAAISNPTPTFFSLLNIIEAIVRLGKADHVVKALKGGLHLCTVDINDGAVKVK